MKCRFCGNALTNKFVDLTNSPPSNSFLTQDQLNEPEVFYPLAVYVCEKCWLVQVAEYKKADDIFNQEYIYFSSYSKSWLTHSKNYVDMVTERFTLDASSQVIEIASNDGYLLQYFKHKNIPCLGIEPTQNTAKVAKDKGIETICDFFGTALACKLIEDDRKADLLIGNNVLAHVPDIKDFVGGLKTALKPSGVITMEFPHLMKLVEFNQFDTIYHEHFSYLSLHIVESIFASAGLKIFDVEQLPTHGGSLRIYAKHGQYAKYLVCSRVEELKQQEKSRGMLNIEYYKNFQSSIDKVKNTFLTFLIEENRQGKKLVAYGAAAKGNTLLNYCGIKKDLISFVVDASPYKQGKFLPGSHIPVVNEQEIRKLKPDYVLILPWNLKSEICEQLKYIRDWEGKFVVAVPKLLIFS